MSTTLASYIPVSRVHRSRLSEVDWDNLQPGAVFTDHMFVCDFADGEWRDAEIVPFGPFSLLPTTLAFHYGQTIFEGMKAFRTEDDRVHIFRVDKHYDRLTRTTARLCMPVIPRELFREGLRRLVALEHEWTPAQPGALYLRPLQIATESALSIRVSKSYRFAIICSPSGHYFSKPSLRVKIEREYVRAVAGGTGYAKCGGNYGGALYPTELAKSEGYDQVLWTDGITHSCIEEAGMMNVFFVIGGANDGPSAGLASPARLVTPALSDTILDGITRDSLLTLAQEMGIPVEERMVSVDELRAGLADGSVTEAFGAGTAAVVSPIGVIGIDGKDYALPVVAGKGQGIADRLKSELDDIRYGRRTDVHGWNDYVHT